MVEQTRQPCHVVSLQAGPGEVDSGTVSEVHLRISARTVRVFARQLAEIGDQLDREWTSRQRNWPPAPLHLLRPAQALTRALYRDLHGQLWGFQGLSTAVRAWIVSTVPGLGVVKAEACTAMVSNLKPVVFTDWTRGSRWAGALVAAVTFFGVLWMEWNN